jgi:hypothetical protein
MSARPPHRDVTWKVGQRQPAASARQQWRATFTAGIFQFLWLARGMRHACNN